MERQGVDEKHDTEVHGRQASYLRYLHFAHAAVTNTRFFNEGSINCELPGNDEMIVACLAEAYQLGNKKEDFLDTLSYNFGYL